MTLIAGPFPFKGKDRMGMGFKARRKLLLIQCLRPIPTPALPLKGREKTSRTPSTSQTIVTLL